MTEEYCGKYQVRAPTKAGGEQLIHVPSTVYGDYLLYLTEDGTMIFKPLGVRKV